MNNKDRTELMSRIGETSFYMDDLRLFLDTHPGNSEAIADYSSYAALRSTLIDDYVNEYGPFTGYCPNNDCNDWLWTVYPWPWEGVC